MKLTNLILLLFAINQVAANDDVDDSTVGQKWAANGLKLRDFIWPHRETIIYYLKEAVNGSIFSRQCKESLQMTTEGLEKQKSWAFEMMDSMGKFGAPFLSGTLNDFGGYDQCLGVSVNETSLPFVGQFCFLELVWPLPSRAAYPSKISLSETEMSGTWLEIIAKVYKSFYISSYQLGICFPSTCSSGEIEGAIQKVLDKASIPTTVKFARICDTKDVHQITFSEFPVYKKISIGILSLLTCLVMVSSLSPKGSLDKRWLIHFRFQENTAKLLNTNREEAATSLSFVHGFRALFILSMVFSHVCFISGFWTPPTHAGSVHYTGAVDRSNWLLSGLLANFANPVAANFVMGGCLAYYSWHPELVKRNGNISLFKYIVGRWFRTTPAIIGTLLSIFAFPVTWGSGPLFQSGLSKVVNNCLNYWWAEVVYVANQIEMRESCLPHAWYFSADFQLYCFSYFVVILLYKKPGVGLTLLPLLSLVGITIHGAYIYTTNTAPFWSFSDIDYEKMLNEIHVLHFSTYNYVSAYCIGLFLGYLIVNNIQIKDRRILALGWIITNGSVLAMIYWASLIHENGYSSLESLVYGSIVRTIGSLYFFWIFYCCFLRKAGWLGSVLSIRLFVPLSRLSMSLFMGQFLFIWFDNFTSRQAIEFRTFSLIMRSTYTFVYSLVVGYLLYLLFEAPFINLAKSMFVAKPTSMKDSKKHP